MKLVFFGDSLTDMSRDRSENPVEAYKYGSGYVRIIASELMLENPMKYQIVNKGIGENTLLNLYTRINRDVWVENPDVLTILIGVNDVIHPQKFGSGTDTESFELIYRRLLEETFERLPNIKIILMCPFACNGWMIQKEMPDFKQLDEFTAIIKKLGKEFNLPVVELQDKFNQAVLDFGVEKVVADGLHPDIKGAVIIADEWLKVFKQLEDK